MKVYKRIILYLFLVLLQTSGFSSDLISQNKVSEYLDNHIPKLLKQHNVSGTVMAIVIGNSVILKAYGTLGFNVTEPMSAENTPMYVASISKLFTATAIFQLYEHNKVAIDKDINLYLSQLSVNNPFGSPITVHHLLTHTAGFDDRFLGMGAPTRNKVLPLGEYLSRRLPPIVFPPSSAISYSNHAFALLGHLVEQTAGINFNDYIQKNIFEPLEMNNTRFDGTYPETLKLPTAYIEYFGKTQRIDMDFAQTPPASSLCTTAENFSHFLIAMLNDGRYNNISILSPNTLKYMQTTQFKLHPLLPGYAYCWEERYINGKRVLQHSGLTWGFSSHTVIIPEEKFGLFISINKGDHAFIYDVIFPVIEAFTLPIKNTPELRKHPIYVIPSFYEHITGFYRHNRYCRSDYFKLATFLPGLVPEIYVRGNSQEQSLTLKYLAFNSSEWKVIELGDMLWGRETKYGAISSSPRITFIPGSTLGSFQLVIGNDVYEPLHFYETKLFQYLLFSSCITVFIFNLLQSVLNYFLCPCLFKTSKKSVKQHRKYISFIGAIFLLYLFSFSIYLFMFLRPQTLGYGTPIGLFILLLLTFPLLILTLIGTVRFICSLETVQIQTFFDLMILLACYGMLYLLHYWNILDFHLAYLETLIY
ncbi:MAG TPA: serine hydrolase [Candidatus Hydrogenedens sp.]|nr:serine hydrolase [Candidatus Hydrogenedens sp.]HOL18969.1 serine hydrolase [Candidatus Hydrogenedens sp.]HPP58979.1 serine hydrolase [Candidatus Hydrogenedens sp.]